MSPLAVFFVLVYGGGLTLAFGALAGELPWGWALLITIAIALLPPVLIESIDWLFRADERWHRRRDE